MTGVSARAWHRLHAVTWLALAVVGGALAHAHIVGRGHWMVRYFPTINYYNDYHGWPIVLVERMPDTPFFENRFAPAFGCALAIDLLVSLLLLLSTASVIERWLRRPGSRLQLRLTTLFVLTAVVAAVLLVVQVEHRLVRGGPFSDPWEADRFRYTPLVWYPWYVRVPLFIGLASAVYTAGRGAVRLGRYLSKLARRG